MHDLLFHSPPLREGRQRIPLVAEGCVESPSVLGAPLSLDPSRTCTENMDHKLPQATYVEGCQHVFKFEDLHNEWENIARVMGVSSEVTLPRLVVGRKARRALHPGCQTRPNG